MTTSKAALASRATVAALRADMADWGRMEPPRKREGEAALLAEAVVESSFEMEGRTVEAW